MECETAAGAAEIPVENAIIDVISEENSHKVIEENIEQDCFQYPPLFTSKTLLELCSSSWSKSPKVPNDVQPYLRGCKWAPDGTCCLSVVNNDGIHLTELPRDLYFDGVKVDRTIDILDSVVHIKESGLVYDFCWYPRMDSNYPQTCCWLTTKQNAPIQLWDAFNGTLRASYRGFNAVDEMEPAISVSFNADCSRIVAGYKKVLRTFDVERPGRDFAEHKISSPAASLATNCDGSVLAVGSWNRSISIYCVKETGTYKSVIKLHGHGGGVTHMKFTPSGTILVSGGRKDNALRVWDMRYSSRPMNILDRVVDTNQRVYFDISPCGKYLVTGGTDGVVKVWDVNHMDWTNSLDVNEYATHKFPLHTDCCNSISIHPCRPILATGSGQHHFTDPTLQLDDLMPKVEHPTDMDTTEVNNSEMKYSNDSENSLVFWWIGDVFESNDNVPEICTESEPKLPLNGSLG